MTHDIRAQILSPVDGQILWLTIDGQPYEGQYIAKTIKGEGLPDILKGYLTEAIEHSIDALIDDPHGVFGTGSEYASTPQEIVDQIDQLRAVCEMLGIDMSEKISRDASSHEFTRLMKIIGDARVLANGANLSGQG